MALLFLTGSSGALASVVREFYLSHGWSVAGFDRTDDGFKHSNYRYHESNALDPGSIKLAMERAGIEQGAPRALIATVGGVKPWKPIEEIPRGEFEFVVQLNLFSLFYAVHAALPAMYTAGIGSIVSIGAEPALSPEPNKAAYVAAKAGVITMTRVVAEEGKLRGVNANTIVPMVIHTKANEEWGSPDEIPKWTQPESIAETCFLLTSEAGHSINGAVIRMPNKL